MIRIQEFFLLLHQLTLSSWWSTSSFVFFLLFNSYLPLSHSLSVMIITSFIPFLPLTI